MVDSYLGGAMPGRDKEDAPSLAKEFAAKGPRSTRAWRPWISAGRSTSSGSCVGRLNTHVNEKTPWKLVKTDKAATEKVLFDLVRCLRIVAGWIEPFMPQTAAKMHAQLGVRQFPVPLSPEQILAGERGAGKILKAPPLFPRK